MADSPHNRRERLGAAVVAALLALSVVAAVAGVGTAHGDGDHVVRNGDRIVITLGDEHFNGTDRNVTVRVDRGRSASLSPVGTTGGESRYRVPVADLSAPNTDLSAATVTVEPANGTAVTESVDLRLLTLDGSGRPTFSNGALEVPLRRALGYADGGSASVTLAGEAAPVADATVHNRSDGLVLSVSLNPASVHLPPSKGAALAAERGNGIEVNLWRLTRAETTVERTDDRTLAIDNPLFVAGAGYDVFATNPATGDTFAGTVTAEPDGTLTLAGERLASAESLAVSVYSEGNAVVENVSYRRDAAGVANATVTANGTAIDVAGATVSAPNGTAVWLANDTRFVRATAPVDDGAVNLTPTPYRLNPNASYRVIVTGDRVVRADVVGVPSANDSDDDTLFYAAGDAPGDGGDGGSGEGSGGLFGGVPGGLPGAAVLGTLVVLGVAVVAIRLRGDDSDDAPDPDEVDSTAVASAHDSGSGHDVDVRVEDAATGSTVSAALEARQKADDAAYRTGGPSSEDADLPDGTGSVTLDSGTWVVEVGSHGVTDRGELSVPVRDQPVTFTLGPRRVEVTVADGRNPLADVPVTCTPDAGRPREGRTDGDGEVTFEVPLAADEVEVSAEADRYDGDDAVVSVPDRGDATARLDLEPLTGDLEATATVDGRPIAGLAVELDPRDADAAELGATGNAATTGDDGAVRFDDLPVGEYEVGLTVSGGSSAFSVESDRVRVADGRTARTELDANFEFSLGRNQRDRVDSVRHEIDEMVSISGRDVAVQRYFGSAVTDLLETVERLPREGHRFARAEADPDAVADALLDAAEASAELVGDAMTTKRNTDLFGACVDMPDHRVEWQEGYDVDALFELLDADRKDQRQTVLTQLRAVDDRIDDERSDLAVVSPAREVWDGVKAFVNEERGDDPVRGAAVAFAAGGLLDAVDELFEHEKLRERLQRTVF